MLAFFPYIPKKRQLKSKSRTRRNGTGEVPFEVWFVVAHVLTATPSFLKKHELK
jgi:hypothetical protein